MDSFVNHLKFTSIVVSSVMLSPPALPGNCLSKELRCLGEEGIWISVGQGKGSMALNSMRQDQVLNYHTKVTLLVLLVRCKRSQDN